MAGLEDRIRRLEASAGLARQESEGDAHRRRVMDRMYHVLANARRELSGLDPLPTPPELEDTREDILRTLRTTIPHYRRHWRHGQGAKLLRLWEDTALEKLSELDKGDEQ
jgi:hypothetical protein